MIELVLRAPQALVEPVSDALADELDALSVSVEDADAGTDAEQALFGEPGMPAPEPGWDRSTLRALFEDVAQAEAAATVLLAQDWTAGLHVQAIQAVPEQDWVRLTQSQFDPVSITPDFWIVPSWHAPPADPRAIVVRLDPGAAFGTGAHPTTRMVLGWLEQVLPGAPNPAPLRLLDYGCGSGILAIAAARLGATAVDAVDLDPLALEATRANAAKNEVPVGVLEADTPPQGDYDVVVANILARPLIVLAPAIGARVRPGGRLALSGVLATQADEVMAAYAPAFSMRCAGAEEDWVLLEGRRAPAPQGPRA